MREDLGRTPLLFLILSCAVILVAGHHGSLLNSFTSFLLLVFLCFSALPFCKYFFGETVNPLLICFPAAYFIHSFLLSLCGWVFGISPVVFTVYAALFVFIAFIFSRRVFTGSLNAIYRVNSWNRSDLLLLSVWLIATIALVAPVLWRAGAETAQGFAYRAYFNGDVFRNMAISGTLMRSGIPAENPYFAGYPLHYYWFFHILPAFWMTLFSSYRPEFIQIQFSLATALAFVAVLFAAIRHLTKSRRTLLFVLPLFLIGGSYEGLFILKYLHDKGLPWTEFMNLNVDGILRWLWRLPQVDTLYRPLLYAPQHLLALSIILINLIVRTSHAGNLPRIAALFLLFLAVGFSVIVTAVGVLVICFMVLVELLQGKWKQIWPQVVFGLIAGPVLLLLYFLGFNMVDPDQGALILGLDPNLSSRFFEFALLQWGPLLIFGLLGLLFALRKDWPYVMIVSYLLLSTAFLLFFRIDVLGLTEVGLKTGYIIDLSLLLLSALFADRIFSSKPHFQKWLIAGGAVLIVPASITWMMDFYNSRDITNSRFTSYISKSRMEMYEWLRDNRKEQIVVQDYRIRSTDFIGSYISEIPAFANRPMYLGDIVLSELFQIPPNDLQRRRKIAAQIVNVEDPRRISSIARREGITHFIVWKKDEGAFHQDQARRYFKRLHEVDEISVFEVTDAKPAIVGKDAEILLEDFVSGEVIVQVVYGKNFYAVEAPEGDEPFRWMSQQAELIIDSAREEQGTLSFLAESFRSPRQMELRFGGEVIHSQTMPTKPTKISIELKIPAGKSELSIGSIQGVEPANVAGGNDSRLLSFKIWRMQFRPSSK